MAKRKTGSDRRARTNSIATLAIEIRGSRIEGRGVFTNGDIPAGIMITEYLGQSMSNEEADRLYADEDPQERTYLFDVGGKFMIDGLGLNTEAALINHSCEPNCEIEICEDRVFIVAARRIRAGEELTYDYGFDPSCAVGIDPYQAYACHCGAKRCRGTMVDLPRKRSRRAKQPAR